MTNSRTDVLQQIFKNFKRKTRLLHSLFSFNRSNVETVCTLEGWIFYTTSRHSFLISVKEVWILRSRGRVWVPHLSFNKGHLWSPCWRWLTSFLPPANEVCEGYVFTGVCLSTLGGMRGFIWGGMHGFIWGVCMVLFGGHTWFYSGGVCSFIRGHAWFFWGGMRGFFSFFGYNEIRSMRGPYTSYWNASLFFICLHMLIFPGNVGHLPPMYRPPSIAFLMVASNSNSAGQLKL